MVQMTVHEIDTPALVVDVDIMDWFGLLTDC
jgi:D-serine deaminase-like pyridoxal phosphate-dependent protein